MEKDITTTLRLFTPLLLALALLFLVRITPAATAIAKVSNLTVDVGQYETINGIMIGDSATTYTYNFTVALANAVSPQIDPYSAVYDSQSTLGGFSNVIALANSKYLTQTQVFQANWNSINYGIFNLTQGSLTTTNINSIITEDNYNGIPTILSIGGSTQSIASVNAICASPNAQNALVANIILAMKGSSTSGNTLAFNGILLDIEDNGAYWTGCGTQGNSLGTTNVLNMVKWVNKLATNITAVNVNDTLGMYIDTGSGVNSSYNYKALSSNGVNYFDDADGIETNGAAYTLGKLSAVANVVGGKSKVNDEWCIEGIANGCDTISNTLSAIANVIPWGFGFSYFTNQFAAYGTNGSIIFNAIASNVIRNTIITHNAIDTNALTSNTFTFKITTADSSNSLQKAKVTIFAGANTLVSKYSANFTINSQLADSWTVSNNPINEGATQTLTANTEGTGTSPYIFNVIVFAANGISVFNSLQGYTSSTTNVVHYAQNSAWGSGTFTANVYITDSASSPATTMNTLTYTVNAPSNPNGVTPPAKIVAYIPVNVINSQPEAVLATTPLYIIYNALAYKNYETSTLSNMELFFRNGTIATSWLEGNYLNEIQPANTLNTSNTVMIWFKSPKGFLPGSSSNTIYLGFAGNTVNPANVLLSVLNGVGMAPQLTCSNPASTATCSSGNGVSGTYGQYDNGNSIFTFYDNFKGTTLNASKWVLDGSPSNIIVDNGVKLYNGTTIISSVPTILQTATTNQIIDSLISLSSPEETSAVGFGTYSNTIGEESQAITYIDSAFGNTHTAIENSGSLFVTTPNKQILQNSLMSLIMFSNTLTLYRNYTYNAVSGGPILEGNTNLSVSLFVTIYNTYVGQIGAYWIRDRIAPPNDTMPSTSFGAPIIQATAGISPPSNAIVDAGQFETFTGTIENNQVSPYTFNFIISNSVTGVFIRNYRNTAVSLTTNTITFQTISADTFNSPEQANVMITDNGGNVLASGYYSFIINTALAASAAPTASNSMVAPGQSTTLTINAPATGTPSYSYMWLAGTSATCNLDSPTGQTGPSATFAPGTTTYYCVEETDSASTPATVYTGTTEIISTAYNLISVTYNPGNQYETSTQPFTYVINITKSASSANLSLVVNGQNTLWNNQSVSSGPNNFIFYYPVPLQPTNDLPYTFNAVLYIDNPSLIDSGTVNTITQNELWNYLPTISIKTANIIQGQNETVNLTINQVHPYNLAAVSAASLNIGNQIASFHILGSYSYGTLLYSFLNSYYGLSIPTYNSPVQVTANVPVQLTFNSKSVWRNQTVGFGTYLESLQACSQPSTATAITWAFNLLPPGAIYTMNVLLTGYYTIKKNTYASNTIAATSAGISGTATSNTYTTCIYPTWGNFSTFGGFTYSANGITASNYYLSALFTSNQVQTIIPNLYNVSTSTSYSIAVENVRSGQYISALVEMLLYNQSTNSSTLVNEFITPAGGTAAVQLQLGANYQFYVYNLTTGDFVASTSFLQAVSCSSACQYVIPIGSYNVQFFQSQISNLDYSCTPTPLSGNSEIVSCTYTSLNGTSYLTTLSIFQNRTAAVSALACTQSTSGVSGSISCTVPNTNTTLYFYDFCVNLDGTCYSLTTGHFGTGSNPFGSDGYLFAILLIVLIVCLLLTRSPEAALITAGAVFVLCSALFNLYSLTNLIIGGVVIMIAVPVYIIRRR